jgi:hypothetical protein
VQHYENSIDENIVNGCGKYFKMGARSKASVEGGYSKADMRKKISEHLCKTDYLPDLSEIAPIPYEVAKSPWNHIKGVTNQRF